MRCFLIAMLALAVPDRQDLTPKQEGPLHGQLLGKWHFVKAVLGNVSLDRGLPGNLVATQDEITPVLPDGETNFLRYVLNENTKPAAIDFIPKGRGQRPLEGILKIEGDTLTICVPVGPAEPRPTEFRANADSKIVLLQFKRTNK